MRNETRELFNAYIARLGEMNGLHVGLGQRYAVEPSVQQTLEGRIQESSEFLGRVNNIGVNEQAGEKIGLGIGSTIASTTDTAVKERAPTDPTTLDADGYFCTQTNFDTSITYAKLDAWAKFPDFQTKIRDAILHRQALDILCIGFNGLSRAATSDRAANPLLQDVNIGWLQKIRANAADRVMGEVTEGSGKVNAFAGGDYENLDALVFDAVNELIDPWYREDTGLVAILGRSLLADKYFPLINAPQPPTEKIAADLLISQKRIGGLAAVRVPYFPENAILITRLDNLSRYYQDGARRRTVIDNPKRDRIENFESSNDAYVVEDYGCAALIEHIATTAPVSP
ncbi:MAG: phage major capsid protein, P2 family [Azoarcus sp.]|jgi:P2 family phage major capsid protein|nr:phage major capsid protein, P2 family [Azoarcus sp.]